VKEEINSADKKMQEYHATIDTTKMQIELLSTEIANLDSLGTKKETVKKELETENNTLSKQVETLAGLKKALQV